VEFELLELKYRFSHNMELVPPGRGGIDSVSTEIGQFKGSCKVIESLPSPYRTSIALESALGVFSVLAGNGILEQNMSFDWNGSRRTPCEVCRLRLFEARLFENSPAEEKRT
jgi:hypothetical protein